MSAADDALRVIMDAIEIDTVAEVSAVRFTPVGLADLAGALADMIEAARAEGEAAGAARERAAVVAYLREPAWATDVAGGIEAGEHVGAAGAAR